MGQRDLPDAKRCFLGPVGLPRMGKKRMDRLVWGGWAWGAARAVPVYTRDFVVAELDSCGISEVRCIKSRAEMQAPFGFAHGQAFDCVRRGGHCSG